MRVLVFGRSGSGKSHFARALAAEHGLARLELDARRPWEPHKYASMEAQQSMLPMLTAWVGQYYERDDACSCRWHRRVFDAYTGDKREISALTPVR